MWRRTVRMARVGGMCAASFAVGLYAQQLVSARRAHAATSLMPLNTPMPEWRSSSDPKAEVFVSRASEIMRHGYPGFDNLRTFEDFVLSYDRRNRTAHWVVEHLTPSRMVYHPSVDRSKCVFHSDSSIDPLFRSVNEDFKGSGYDRGHLAAAGNHRRSQNAIEQTFLLSNMAPQVGKGFNRDKWNELEKRVRSLARKHENVYVCTGPLYLPRMESDGNLYVKYKVIGKNNVAVPTHFFKVALIEVSPGKFDIESYVLPNEVIPDSVPLSMFFTPVNSIERSAGFRLFDKLAGSSLRNVNGKKAGKVW